MSTQPMPSKAWPEFMRRMAGTWSGECKEYDAKTGTQTDSFSLTEWVGLSEGISPHRITRRWVDGREEVLEFNCVLEEDGRVTWDEGFSSGFLKSVSESVALIRVDVKRKGVEGMFVFGTFSLVEEGRRIKTMQVVVGGDVLGVQHVVQTKS